jgi:peptidyl-prolyl cis-trans isomerase D
MDSFLNRLYQFGLAAIVILLAVVFALQFGGPQAEGCSSGGATFAANVHGTSITAGDFRSAWVLGSFDRYATADPEQAREVRTWVLDGLIERELLARRAEDLGFEVAEDEVMRHLARRGTVYLSVGADAPPTVASGEIPVPVRDRDGEFDLESAKRFIQYGLRRSIAEFGDSQQRETLAHRMRELITASVSVSPEEVWDNYRRDHDTAKVHYVRFAPTFYRDTLAPSAEEVAAWRAENAEAVDRDYEANRYQWTGLEKQMRLRQILVRASESASEDVRAAARTRADAALARVRRGEDFAEVARAESDDRESARRGGDQGWVPRGRVPGEHDDIVFALEPGQVSDVIESPLGFHVVKVEGVREGDVPEEEAKAEIAERLFREARAVERAEQAAGEALAALRAGKTIDELRTELGGTPPEGGTDEDPLEPEEPVDPLAPRVEETRAFGRADTPVAGISDNGPFVQAAFELSDEAPLPEGVIRAGGDFFVLSLSERNVVTREDLGAEDAERIRTGLLNAKRRQVLRVYIDRLRSEAEAAGAIRIHEEILEPEQDEEG